MAIVQPFVLCRDIGETEDATEMVIVGPFSRARVGQFPIEIQICAYAQVYELDRAGSATLALRDASGNAIWTHPEPIPLGNPIPGSLHRIVLRELRVLVEKPGEYELVLSVDSGGEARHPLIVSQSH